MVYLQVFDPVLPLHLLEQQSLFTVHEAPIGEHEVAQEGFALQSESLQSTS